MALLETVCQPPESLRTVKNNSKTPNVRIVPWMTSCQITAFKPPRYVFTVNNAQPIKMPKVIFSPIVRFNIEASATNCIPVIAQYENRKLMKVGRSEERRVGKEWRREGAGKGVKK